MIHRSRPGLSRVWGFLAVAALAGCQTAPTGAEAPIPPSARVRVVFTPQDHHAEQCLKALAASLEEVPDGVLFYDRDSRIRVTPPRGQGIEPYHCHVRHRVGNEICDSVVCQDAKGFVEVDLSRFDRPETLLVTSSALVWKSRKNGVKPAPGAPRPPDDPIMAPYAMSFRLVPSDQVEVLTSIQPFRYEVASPLGKLQVFVQSFNRRDFLCTWIDAGRKLGPLIAEDPHVYYRPEEGVIPPRLTVDVFDAATGKAWQRAGTWHLPETIVREEDPAKKPFVLRTARRDLVAFNAPPGVDLAVPTEPAGTSARIQARFSGLGEKDAIRLTLAARVPVRLNLDFNVRTQSDEINSGKREANYVVGLNPDDPYPLTAALVHRFTQPWRMTGGMYRPEPPLGVGTVTLDREGPETLPRLPKRVVAPKYASHYDWVLFLGDGKGRAGQVDQGLLDCYQGKGPDEGPSPNIPPPPIDIPGGGVPPPLPVVPPPPPSLVIPPGGGTHQPGMGGSGLLGGLGPSKGDEDPPPPRPGKITINLSCPLGPEGCHQDPEACKCPDHLWTMGQLMGIIAPAFPGAADLSWSGLHGDMAPCCKKSLAGMLRVSTWSVDFQLHQTWYDVAVKFGPCAGKEMPPKQIPPKPPEKPKEEPPKPGGAPAPGPGPGGPGKPPPPADPRPPGPTVDPARSPLTIIEGRGLRGEPQPLAWLVGLGSALSSPVTDPNLMVATTRIAAALGLPLEGGPTRACPVELLNPKVLSVVLEVKRLNEESFRSAYWGSPESSLDRTMDLLGGGPLLDLFVQGVAGSLSGAPPAVVGPPISPCGALGIEFVAILGLIKLLRRRRG